MTDITQTPIQNHDMKDLDGITQQVIRVLADMGITFPTPIDPSTIVQFPLDITQIGLLELGELQSFWTAMYARDTGVHGVVIAQKRALKFQISRVKQGIPSIKDEDAKARALTHQAQLEAQFARVDGMDVILEGVCDSHKRYADAASRELSRRQIEASLSR